MLFFTLVIIAKLFTTNALTQISFEEYPRYSSIQSNLNDLYQMYPDRVKFFSIGRTFEGRDIYAVKIFSDKSNFTKPAILMDAGIHAREWMSPLVVLYIINELVTNPYYENMRQNVDWFFIPVLNPDGYEYSHIYDRMWRKNRRKGTSCSGVDLNRNFGFHWSKEISDECSEVYAGPTKESELETKALERFALSLRKKLKLYITLHTFGSYIFYPWAYTNSSVQNQQEHLYLAEQVAYAIQRVRGTKYEIGLVANLMYPAFGSSMDWMVGVAKVPLGFAFELEDRYKMFNPPVEDRQQIAKEMFEGMIQFHEHIENKWHFGKNTSNRKLKRKKNRHTQ